MKGTRTSSTYEINGIVRAGRNERSGTPVAGARMRFQTTDEQSRPTQYLGETTTRPDGKYSFSFNYTNKARGKRGRAPGLKVNFYQFVDGAWTELNYATSIQMTGSPQTQDFLVPNEAIVSRCVTASAKPWGRDGSFRFGGIGCLPVDRIDRNGYVTSVAGDPIKVTNQPLGGVLRISGLFSNLLNVMSYRVEVAAVDNLGQQGPWCPVLDPLINQYWNGLTMRYVQKSLGPDKDGLYTNVDYLPGVWYEPQLKVSWVTSSGWPDGLYTLRITGYPSLDNPAYATMPMVFLSNGKPTVNLNAVCTANNKPIDNCGCGELDQIDRRITFQVDVDHPQGHVLTPILSGTRGKKALSAGSNVSPVAVPPPSPQWPGIHQPLDFTALPKTECAALAYRFSLLARSSATDCRSQYIYWNQADSNLILSEAKPQLR